VSERTFTGERLHPDDALFGVDLAQHRAAYRFALRRAREGGARHGAGRVLELGSGAGYGAAELAGEGLAVTAVDRVAPLPGSRMAGARFVRADVTALPLRAASFDLVVSFQVIEHLDDPGPYLEAMARMLAPGGEALITTPNLLTSLGVNPYHLHEYGGAELAGLLGRHFAQVDVRGVGASEPVQRYLDARRVRIQRILHLDPLRLRDRLPRGLVDRLFAFFALVVRRGIRRDDALPDVSWRDFPVAERGPAPDDCVDLLAVCRQPLR
jgi:SAM-dependent methyltransferase